eukprot:scpid4539/ scgid22144/ Protein sidekick-1
MHWRSGQARAPLSVRLAPFTVLLSSLLLLAPSTCWAAFRPRFISEPQDVLVSPNEPFTAVLPCTPAAPGDVRGVQWQFGEAIIERAGDGLAPTRSRNRTTWMLQIDDRLTSSSRRLLGQYSCIVDYGIYGKLKSRTAHIRTFGAENVRLLGPKAELMVAENNTAILRCTAIFSSIFRNSRRVTVETTWFTGMQETARPIRSGDSGDSGGVIRNAVVLPSGNLQFPHVKLSDSGHYFCNAKVTFDGKSFASASKTAQLVVERTMKNVSCRPQPQDGDCTNSDLYYYNSLTYRCQKYLPLQCKPDGSHNYFRDIHSCEAACMTARSLHQVNVYTEQRTVVSFVGKDVTLECFATGLPRPRIGWRKDGSVSGVPRPVNGNLVLERVRTTSSGVYTCNAQNQFQREVKTVNMIVVNPLTASFRLTETELTITRYQWRSVTCSANDFLDASIRRFAPTCQFEWLLGGRPAPYRIIDSSPFHSQLNVTGEHFGVLQCRVTRQSTEEHHQGAIFINPKPPTPRDLVVKDTRHNSTVIHWHLDATRPRVPLIAIEVVWHKNDNARPTNHNRYLSRDKRSVQLSALEQDTVYVVEMRTINRYGRGTKVTKMIRTIRIKPNHPRNVTVSVVNGTSALVSWKLPTRTSPPVTIHGHIVRYLAATGAGSQRQLWQHVNVPLSAGLSRLVSGLSPFTRYTFVVHAYTVSRDYKGSGSAAYNATTAWSNLFTSAINSTTVRLAWSSLPRSFNATAISIYQQRVPADTPASETVATGSGPMTKIATLSTSSTLHLATGLSPLTTYRFMASVDSRAVGILNTTQSHDVTTARQSPAPIRFLANPASSRSIQLTWEFPDDADPRLGPITRVEYQIIGDQVLPWSSVPYSSHKWGRLVRHLAVEHDYIFLVRCVTARGGYGPARTAMASTERFCKPPIHFKEEHVTDRSLRIRWFHSSLGDYCVPQNFNVRLYHNPPLPGVENRPIRELQISGKEEMVEFDDLIQGYHYLLQVEATATTETQTYVSTTGNMTFYTRVRTPTPPPQHVSVRYASNRTTTSAVASAAEAGRGVPEIRWWLPVPSPIYSPFMVKLRFMTASNPDVVFRVSTFNVSKLLGRRHFRYSPKGLPNDGVLFDMRILYAKQAHDVVSLADGERGQSLVNRPLSSIASGIRTGRRRRDMTINELLVYSEYTDAILLHTPYGACCDNAVSHADANQLVSAPLHVMAQTDNSPSGAGSGGSVLVSWHAPRRQHDLITGYVIYTWLPEDDTGARPMRSTMVTGRNTRSASLTATVGKVHAYRVTAVGQLGESAMSHRAFAMLASRRQQPPTPPPLVPEETHTAVDTPDSGDSTGSAGNSAVVAGLVTCFVVLLVFVLFAVIALMYRRRKQIERYDVDGARNATSRGAAGGQKDEPAMAPTPVMWPDTPVPPYTPTPNTRERVVAVDNGAAHAAAVAHAARGTLHAPVHATRSGGSSSGVFSDGGDSSSDSDAEHRALDRNPRRSRSNSLPAIEAMTIHLPPHYDTCVVPISARQHKVEAEKPDKTTVRRSSSLNNTNSIGKPLVSKRQRSRPPSPPQGPPTPPPPPPPSLADTPAASPPVVSKVQSPSPAKPTPAAPKLPATTPSAPYPMGALPLSLADCRSTASNANSGHNTPTTSGTPVPLGRATPTLQLPVTAADTGRKMLSRCASDDPSSMTSRQPPSLKTSTMPRFKAPTMAVDNDATGAAYSETSLLTGITHIGVKKQAERDYDEPEPFKGVRSRSASVGANTHNLTQNHYASVHLTAGGVVVEEDASLATTTTPAKQNSTTVSDAFIEEDDEDILGPGPGYTCPDSLVAADKKAAALEAARSIPDHYQNRPLTRDQHVYSEVNPDTRRKNSVSHYAAVELKMA